MRDALKSKLNIFRDKSKELGYSDACRKIVCFLIGGEPKLKNEEKVLEEFNLLLDKKLNENDFLEKAISIVKKES